MGIQIREITAVEDASRYDDGETLLILKDTFPNLRISSNLCSSWISSDAEVSYQRLQCGARIKEHARFHEMGKLLANSGHEDSILMMDENILDGNMAHKLLEEAPRYLQEDWFEEFPEHLRPSKICLVLGGLGARSELHLDPLSWTGWNCLLEGTKLWRFYTQKATFHGDVLLQRPFGIGPKAEFCSIGQSVISSIDTWRFRDFRKGDGLPVPVEYLQRPGETLIFPGTWWHQTYHLSHTVALAGQILNHRNLHRVMRHIITYCNLKVEEELWDKEPKEVIREVLGDAIDAM